MFYKYCRTKIFLRDKLLLVSFCYNSGKCFISTTEIKLFLGQNLLLGPLCYDTEKYCIGIIRMKIFLGQNLLLVSFWFC